MNMYVVQVAPKTITLLIIWSGGYKVFLVWRLSHTDTNPRFISISFQHYLTIETDSNSDGV